MVTPGGAGASASSSAGMQGKVGLLDNGQGKQEAGEFLPEYTRCYGVIMRRKLGLLSSADEHSDDGLVEGLLNVMEATGADYTNTFRWLMAFPMPEPFGTGSDSHALPEGVSGRSNGRGAGADPGLNFLDGGFLERIVSSLPGPNELAEAIQPLNSVETIHSMLAVSQRDPRILREGFGTVAGQLEAQLRVWKTVEELRKMTTTEKTKQDRRRWRAWLNDFGARLSQEAASGTDPAARLEAMRCVNPRVVPREAALASALSSAEVGSFVEVNSLLEQLLDPFAEEKHLPAVP